MSDLIAAPAVIPSLRLTSTDGPGGRRLISAKALEALVDRLEAEQNDAGLLELLLQLPLSRPRPRLRVMVALRSSSPASSTRARLSLGWFGFLARSAVQ